MEPTINDGSIFIVKKKHYDNIPIKRFDIVLVRDREDKEYITKRIIALEGEKVEIIDGDIYVNDKLIKDRFFGVKIAFGENNTNEKSFVIPKNSVWVIGDNRALSHYGVYNIEDLRGKAYLLF